MTKDNPLKDKRRINWDQADDVAERSTYYEDHDFGNDYFDNYNDHDDFDDIDFDDSYF